MRSDATSSIAEKLKSRNDGKRRKIVFKLLSESQFGPVLVDVSNGILTIARALPESSSAEYQWEQGARDFMRKLAEENIPFATRAQAPLSAHLDETSTPDLVRVNLLDPEQQKSASS